MESEDLTKKIIQCAFKVSNTLGNGFLEKVYENALAHELRKNGIQIVQQHPLNVMYEKTIVGEYMADLVVNSNVLIELKVVKELNNMHKAQCINYLKATGLKVCLLINFGQQKVQIKRITNNFLCEA